MNMIRYAIVTLTFCLVGCAASPEPRRVKAADLGSLGPIAEGQPLVVEFAAGDTIPLHFDVDGPMLASPKDAAPIALQVKQRFFLWIGADGLRSSLDGKDFGKPSEPGQFKFGVGATKAGAEARMSIRTPRPAGVSAPPRR